MKLSWVGFNNIRYSVTVLLLSLLLVGCDVGSRKPVITKIMKGGVDYEIRGYGECTSERREGVLNLKPGDYTIQIREGAFSVDGKDYGPVKKGDTVLTDVDGSVSINGKKQ